METKHNNQVKSIHSRYDYSATPIEFKNKEIVENNTTKYNTEPVYEAESIIIETEESQVEKTQKEEAGGDMLWGAVWCIGGIAITAATYSAASGGGTFIIAYGAIISGAFQFFRGLFNS